MAKANPVRGKPLNGTKKHQTAKPAKQETAKAVEEKMNWDSVERQVRSLSRADDEGVRLTASPEEILAEAQRLARIYQKAGKPLPDTLAALV